MLITACAMIGMSGFFQGWLKEHLVAIVVSGTCFCKHRTFSIWITRGGKSLTPVLSFKSWRLISFNCAQLPPVCVITHSDPPFPLVNTRRASRWFPKWRPPRLSRWRKKKNHSHLKLFLVHDVKIVTVIHTVCRQKLACVISPMGEVDVAAWVIKTWKMALDLHPGWLIMSRISCYCVN